MSHDSVISPSEWATAAEALRLRSQLLQYVDAEVNRFGSTEPVQPGHRVKFHWPPHPISYKYHVLSSDWKGSVLLKLHGEVYDVDTARTPFGIFGRCEKLWLEARGNTVDEMLMAMKEAAEPYFKRMILISETLGESAVFHGSIRHLEPLQLLKLLYCPDRDVANEARSEIEMHAGNRLFTPSLIAILEDERHPYRRSAQWCVLDLFEDLPSYCRDVSEERLAVEAIRKLLWTAEDDYARTVYKAGVVLGGHLPEEYGGPVLLECLQAPSPIGRRSAIHGLFHVVEWVPDLRSEIAAKLLDHAENEPNPYLANFATGIAHDLTASHYDHVPEPLFENEL